MHLFIFLGHHHRAAGIQVHVPITTMLIVIPVPSVIAWLMRR